jgi:hypothetical protein
MARTAAARLPRTLAAMGQGAVSAQKLAILLQVQAMPD